MIIYQSNFFPAWNTSLACILLLVPGLHSASVIVMKTYLCRIMQSASRQRHHLVTSSLVEFLFLGIPTALQ